ncbi:MAG: endonuclease/exonuclease/phosphatase family protein [Bryobacterales bacterium]|nr:endonuclease/exonuclease/phosphatase family protein [Bryobacterales bacterium]
MNIPAVLLSAFLLVSVAQADSLTVMTFNVRYPSPADGGNVWENRKDILVESIRKYQPDVLGTQELFDFQGGYIAERLPDYEWFGISRQGNHENEHMGVFYKRDELFVVESGNFWLSEDPDKAGSMSWGVSLPRMVTWARFRDLEGEEFYLYNTHFAHRRQDAAARLNSARVIVEDIRRRVPAFARLIVMGDFNSVPDSDVHELLTTELVDAWESGGERSGPETTLSGWSGNREGRRIDWILYRGDWRPTSVQTVDHNLDGRYPSDHYPVVAVLEDR